MVEQHPGRICIKCARSNPEVTFQSYRKQCNACAYARYASKHRDHNLKRNYGITLLEYEEMLDDQGGVCLICGTSEARGRSNMFHVDHDHATGIVRGLLCAGCNLAIGHMRESPETARAIADYLEDWRALNVH